jgi:hypothetical protein
LGEITQKGYDLLSCDICEEIWDDGEYGCW